MPLTGARLFTEQAQLHHCLYVFVTSTEWKLIRGHYAMLVVYAKQPRSGISSYMLSTGWHDRACNAVK